ncbi:MAG: hypothetical protein JW715_02270 [Sedimentisphaerales bacterium]|nr:hypothetical protein [Sedimentisphaerales bacterium]
MVRFIQIAALICLYSWLAGCIPPDEDSLTNGTKIQDLAPKYNDGNGAENQLQTINFDMHIYEVPADNIDKIDEIRRTLDIKQFRYNNRLAFSNNFFSVYFGKLNQWNIISDLLINAGAERRSRTSLLMPDGQTKDFTVAGFDYPLTVFYTSSYGLKEGARVGPGFLTMRIKVGNSPSLRDAAEVTIYPVFTIPIGTSIPELDTQIKTREFPFTAAAFGLNMNPGDFIFLSPEKYVEDQSTLGYIFFNNPRGNMFFEKDKRKPPELKPSFRVYMLTCTGINN